MALRAIALLAVVAVAAAAAPPPARANDFVAGHTAAMTAIAGLFERGEGVAADARRAAVWCRRAALAGDAVAQMNLGDMLADGCGVRRDPVAAYVWLARAARQGQAWAGERLAALAAGLDAAARSAAKARLAAEDARAPSDIQETK